MSEMPDFQTLDELVTFWDEHDLTDYWDELKEVSADEAMPSYTHRVSLELPLDTLMEAIEQLPLDDARQLYNRLGERLGSM